MDQQLSRGLVGWRRWWEARVGAEVTLGRGVAQLLDRELSRGWATWSEAAQERSASLASMHCGAATLRSTQFDA